jgi:hypothetical protein
VLQPRFGSRVADFAAQKALRSTAALVAEIEHRARFFTTTCLGYLIVPNSRKRRFTIQPYTSAEVPPANIDPASRCRKNRASRTARLSFPLSRTQFSSRPHAPVLTELMRKNSGTTPLHFSQCGRLHWGRRSIRPHASAHQEHIDRFRVAFVRWGQ